VIPHSIVHYIPPAGVNRNSSSQETVQLI